MYADTEYRLHQLCEENPELSELMVEYQNEMKYLLSTLTHEIRNPLTLMYSTIQLMEKKHPDLKQLSYWSTLCEDMNSVFSLLDGLSSFNHCDTLHKEPIDLIGLLTDLKVSFEPLAKEKNLPISITITNLVHPYATTYYGDKVKLKQVFTNLIKNAIEASDINSSIHLKFSLTEDPTESNNLQNKKNFLCISVSNHGTLIPKEDIDHIFQPFFTTKKTGTGLGLPTARRILLSHNGYLTVTSKEESTSFFVYLPL